MKKEKKILIFNPRYEDLPKIVKSLDGLVPGCKKCSQNTTYCPKAIENFLVEVVENTNIEVILISELYWKKNYDRSAIGIVEATVSYPMEVWITDTYIDDFSIGVFELEKGTLKIQKDLKEILRYNSFWNNEL